MMEIDAVLTSEKLATKVIGYSSTVADEVLLTKAIYSVFSTQLPCLIIDN